MKNEKGGDRPLEIRAKPPKSSTLNKKLIAGGVAVLCLIVLWLLVVDFGSSTDKKAARQKAEPSTTVSGRLNSLPGSYTDAKGIAAYLRQEKEQGLPPEVLAQLKQLRESQARLQKELADLKKQPAQQTQSQRTPPRRSSQNDAELRQAARSNIFFGSMAPSKKTATAAAAATKKSESGTSATSGKPGDYAAQNMQAQKQAFLAGGVDKQADIYNEHRLTRPASPYEIQAGTVLPVALMTGVNTNLPGIVVAQLRQNVYDSVTGRYLLMPQGTRLIGEYSSSVSYGQEQAQLVFYRAIMPNGDSILLDKMQGAGPQGTTGVEGNVNNHWGKILGSATISALLSLGSGVAAGSYRGTNSYYPSAPESALYGVAGSVSGTGQQLTDRALNVQPTLTIPPGYEFNVIVNKDIVLEPYNATDNIQSY